MFKRKLIVKVALSSTAAIPEYHTEGSAGLDLAANLNIEPIIVADATYEKTLQSVKIKPFGRVLIKTGIKVEIPKGYELQIRPRSGLSLKSGLMVSNSPGTIDSDYRGDIGIIITNVSNKTVIINHGDRIAQAVLSKFERITFKVVNSVEKTERGEGGFGSTGK